MASGATPAVIQPPKPRPASTGQSGRGPQRPLLPPRRRR
jgi:hypothetical protein